VKEFLVVFAIYLVLSFLFIRPLFRISMRKRKHRDQAYYCSGWNQLNYRPNPNQRSLSSLLGDIGSGTAPKERK